LILEIDGAGRTEFLTRLASAILEIDAVIRIDGIFQGNRLGISQGNRFGRNQPFIVKVSNFLGAFLPAKPAGDALFRIDIPRVLQDVDGEAADVAGDIGDFGQRKKLNVVVPADLDQFR